MELRRNTAPSPLRCCSSLFSLHRDQKRRLLGPEDVKLAEESAPKAPSVMSPSSQSSCRTSRNATCTQQAHLKPPPTAPPESSRDHVATPSLINPQRERLTETPFTDHIFPVERKGPSVSATSEASRLKMKKARRHPSAQ